MSIVLYISTNFLPDTMKIFIIITNYQQLSKAHMILSRTFNIFSSNCAQIIKTKKKFLRYLTNPLIGAYIIYLIRGVNLYRHFWSQ